MKTYRLTKIGSKTSKKGFGDTQEFFEGIAYEKPTLGERFNLYNSSGEGVISTSPLVTIARGVIYTTYSCYKIEEV